LDERFPDWGTSPYFSVTLSATTTLARLLTHLYVLIPVFDNAKHYYIGDDELEKLLAKGEGWLASHPEKELTTRRYLKNRVSLYREALARLVVEEEVAVAEAEDGEIDPDPKEENVPLNEVRLGAVIAALRSCDAKSVLDLGCGEGKLLQSLARERHFERIVGMDVSIRALEIAHRRL